MLKISPLEWTDLNPKAIPFLPKNSKDVRNINSNKKSESLSKPSGSNGPKHSTSKYSVVTIEQFISEKLKIENSVKNDTNYDKNRKKKVQTNEIPANTLDSTAPTRKRGKERENPKPKKPTALKKIIINERNSLKANQQNCTQTQSLDLLNKNQSLVENLEEINKRLLHCNRYREYCNQSLWRTIDEFVVNLLSDLVVFQDRMYAKSPLKAQMKKRLCFGFKEVTKYSVINKVKMLFIAPDIEKIEAKGGLDQSLSYLMKITKTNETPVVFALNRKRLGITCKKRGFVSCIGILNYDGSQDNFKQLISLCESARNEYNTIFEESLNKLKNMEKEEIEDLLNKLPHISKEFCEFRNILIQNVRPFDKTKKTVSQQ